MTRNEKIARRMKWEIYSATFGCPMIQLDNKECFRLDNLGQNTPAGLWLAKLLQAKMVADDKLMICIWQISDKLFSAEAFTRTKRKDGQSFIAEVDADTEPAALHALFCKVYGITEPASIAGGITV